MTTKPSKPAPSDTIRDLIVAYSKKKQGWWMNPRGLIRGCVRIAKGTGLPWTHVANEVDAMIVEVQAKGAK